MPQSTTTRIGARHSSSSDSTNVFSPSRTSSLPHNEPFSHTPSRVTAPPQRTFSAPMASFYSRQSPYSTTSPTGSTGSGWSRSTDQPRSATMKLAHSKSEGGGGDGNGELAQRLDDKTRRRYSHEPRVNVHTECGRHSDDWLFGGVSVTETVKKLWEKR